MLFEAKKSQFMRANWVWIDMGHDAVLSSTRTLTTLIGAFEGSLGIVQIKPHLAHSLNVESDSKEWISSE